MLKNLLIVLAGVGIAFIIFLIVLQFSNKKAEEMVNLLYVKKDTEGYRKVADSFLAKLIVGSKQRLIFDMTYYRMTENDEKLEEVFSLLANKKLSPQESFERFQNAFQYYLKNERYEELEEEYQNMVEKYSESEDMYVKGTMKEFQYMYSVDYKGDVSLLKEMEERYENISFEQSKGIFAFRCYHLCVLNNEKKKAEKYKNQAIRLLGKEAVNEMMKIQHISAD